ncbi:MAG: 4-hydroxy-tetrahydrodipicolinate synthase [Cyclobacteriaceae bacterium]
MKGDSFKGTGVALATPFAKDGSVDHAGLERLVTHTLDGGLDYLVVMGTTAESPTLSMSEKADVLSTVVSSNKKGLPIIYGAGANDTAELCDYFKDPLFSTVDAILSVAPYYNKPSQKGLQAHFEKIADHSPVPVILYNVPSRTVVNLEASTTLCLAQHENIRGIKEASGDFNQCNQLLAEKPEDFLVISGEDMITLPLLSMGASGVISVMANAYPKQFSTLVNQALLGKYDKARKIHLSLVEMGRILSEEGNPAGLKCVLELLGICEGVLRLPLVPISPELKVRAQKAINELNKKG